MDGSTARLPLGPGAPAPQPPHALGVQTSWVSPNRALPASPGTLGPSRPDHLSAGLIALPAAPLLAQDLLGAVVPSSSAPLGPETSRAWSQRSAEAALPHPGHWHLETGFPGQGLVEKTGGDGRTLSPCTGSGLCEHHVGGTVGARQSSPQGGDQLLLMQNHHGLHPGSPRMTTRCHP